jgi:hypothetical protein
VPNPPQILTAEAKDDGVHLNWSKPAPARDHETASGYVIYRFKEGEKISILDPQNILKISFEEFTFFLDTAVEKGSRYNYLVTALDRLKNESDPSGPVGVQVE